MSDSPHRSAAFLVKKNIMKKLEEIVGSDSKNLLVDCGNFLPLLKKFTKKVASFLERIMIIGLKIELNGNVQ